MLVLHALWSGGAGFCLFAEDSQRQTSEPGVHPFVPPAGRIGEVAAVLGWPAPSGHGELALLLPSSSSIPLPSPGLPARKTHAVAPRLRRWRVPATHFKPGAALDLLLRLPSDLPSGITLGSSLPYWERLAEVAVELLARGRYLPELYDAGGERFAARWRPALSPEDLHRVRLMAEAMPPMCRAEQDGIGHQGRPAAQVLDEALSSLIDAGARSALRPFRARFRGTWLRALATDDLTIVVDDVSRLRAAAHSLQSWRSTALPAAAPFRTCFRVTPPAREEGKRWQVEFLLQAVDDPSLLVPAAEVWRSAERLVAFQRSLTNPQERLLADLGRASRLNDDIERALRGAQPVGVTLDAESAYRFLSEAGPLLSEAGFGVLVPPWWRSAASRLGSRLVARPRRSSSAGATGTGLLGQEGILDYQWEVALGDETLGADELRELARLKTPLVELRGRWVELRAGEIEAALSLLERGSESERELGPADVLRAGTGLDAGPGALPVVEVRAEGWLGQLLSGTAAERLTPASTPAGFQGVLRPYQERGLAWLRFLGGLGLGACLADDMGLGKTVQLLALLVDERADAAPSGPTLLVCPMSVVGNWEREAARFAPGLSVYVHHGSGRRSGQAVADAAAACDLVITTYGLAARDRGRLSPIQWARIVLDEAQNVKNAAALQSQAVRSLRAHQRVALTGTPVENRLSELWSIMDFLNPTLLGSPSEFRRRFAVPIERYRDDAAADQLRRITTPFVLRRVKTDRAIIADLPDKVEMKAFCNITREQATLYQAVLNDMLAQIERSDGIARRGLVLATLLKLKQVCNHPAHLLQDGSRLNGRSGKLDLVEEVLDEMLGAGDRVILFTQFAEWGRRLTVYFEERLGREVSFLHGATPRRTRDNLVARFQAADGPRLFVISLRAGGVGLNLTAANQVIHFDRWWNPAVEDQATDRAYRIGQRRGVQVRKLICVGTLEERIDRMIETKKDLAARIVGSGETWLTELSTAELRAVVALSDEAVAEENRTEGPEPQEEGEASVPSVRLREPEENRTEGPEPQDEDEAPPPSVRFPEPEERDP
jgi:non-specific serine/threonine protein kinase